MSFGEFAGIRVEAKLRLVFVDPKDELIVFRCWSEWVVPRLLDLFQESRVSELAERRVIINAVIPFNTFNWILKLLIINMSMIKHIWVQALSLNLR